ncbi:MAG: hypothetical protein ABIG89_00370 [Candidatus Woesearchaeota archaeon]
MSVTVGNAGPTVDNLVIDGNDINGSTVTPNTGAIKTVKIEAVVSDDNGYGDVSSVICTTPKGSVGLIATSIVDETTRNWNGSFNMEFYDNPQIYNIECTATDANTDTGSRLENFDYDTLTALELDSDTIAFGSMTPGATRTITGDTSMATPNNSTIQNYGNVEIDATIAGTDLSDGGSNTITVNNAEYQFSALGFSTMSTSATPVNINLAKGSSSTTNVDFRLSVPEATQVASYDGGTTITATSS